ncbi:MAG: arylesterase [Planctomycetota bacterium]
MRPKAWLRSILALIPALGACAVQDQQPALSADAGSKQPTPPLDPQAKGPLVVFLGDSLTAGSGLAESESYPTLIRQRLARDGRPARVVNAGVSGDTSAGGLARLSWLLAQHPDLVVVALGANDGLRGMPVLEMERNLTEIVRRSRDAGAQVLLLGMRIPPNYGEDYALAFEEVYPRLAKASSVALVPFLLDGVGGIPALNQADGLHPTAQGQEIMADTVWKGLSPLLATK